MDDMDKVIWITFIGTFVADFLLNTGRVQKVIELCKECLIHINIAIFGKQEEIVRLAYGEISSLIFKGYQILNDYTSGIEFGTQLLVFLRGCGEAALESKATFHLAKLYHDQSKYKEAKELYKKALGIRIEIGDKKGQAVCYGNLGTVYQSLGQYGKAEEHQRKALLITNEIGHREGEAACYGNLGAVYQSLSQYDKAEEYLKKAIVITNEIGHREGEAACYGNLGAVYQSLSQYDKAEEYLKKAIVIRKEIGDRKGEAVCYGNLGTVYESLGQYGKAEEHQRKALVIRKEIGDKEGEAVCYGNLGTVYESLGQYGKAEEHQRKALVIRKEIGDKEGEAVCYGNLRNVYESLGQYGKAEEHQRKALVITKEIGDREGEAVCYGNLGSVYESLGQYDKAEEHQRKALLITKEIGDREGEAACYENLGIVYGSLGQYGKAEEHQRKALVIRKEIGDRKGEAVCYGNLGSVYESLGQYGKAEEHQRKALVIRKEIGDREGEAACYGNLGNVYESLGQYGKAEEHQRKALLITKEIGDRKGEAACYGNLGTVSTLLGQYGTAEAHQRKALVIRKEIGDRKGEAACYGNLGAVYQSLGQYNKAEEYLKKALVIRKEIGDREGEAVCYGNLGTAYDSLGQYGKAEEYLKKALVIRKEIGHRKGEAACYGNLGAVYESLGHYGKAEEYLKKALVLRKEIGDREGEAGCYLNIGTVFRFRGKCANAKEYHEKALAISKETGNIAKQLVSHLNIAYDALFEGTTPQHDVCSNLNAAIHLCEEMRIFLGDNDQFKISLLDKHAESYNLLSTLLCDTGKLTDALHVLELGRGRALTDLMSSRYSVDGQTPVNLQSLVGIERIMKKESNCSCLYISYFFCYMFMWVLEEDNLVFRRIDVNECFVTKGSQRSVDKVFGNESFRKFHVFPQEDCEDRSLLLSNISHPNHKSFQQDGITAVRLIEDEEDANQQPVLTLAECYQMIIAPVADFLGQPELVIVPDRALYKVPFAALKDEKGKYLAESFRIRIVPSLTTLRLIQDSPGDYHIQTGALIVGDPEVGDVFYKGGVQRFSSLPCARKEAEMIGRLVGDQPLLGKQATKQAVLQSIHSVSLIHFAAHGNAESGEIALAPPQPINTTPNEEDYLLTMVDISQVRLRAKLVVLSCCHSARGQITTEGVIGIARAFLGSGARSVLVALWAIPDKSTEQLMNRFYEHLVRGESASESLHEAVKWMRSNGYSDVRDWAPFMLIGDNVSFDFGK